MPLLTNGIGALLANKNAAAVGTGVPGVVVGHAGGNKLNAVACAKVGIRWQAHTWCWSFGYLNGVGNGAAVATGYLHPIGARSAGGERLPHAAIAPQIDAESGTWAETKPDELHKVVSLPSRFCWVAPACKPLM